PRMNPRVSPTARMIRVTPRRLPSNRRNSQGTPSWADENADGSTPITVASAGPAGGAHGSWIDGPNQTLAAMITYSAISARPSSQVDSPSNTTNAPRIT